MTSRVGGDAIIRWSGSVGARAPAAFSLTVQISVNMIMTRPLVLGLPAATAPAGPGR